MDRKTLRKREDELLTLLVGSFYKGMVGFSPQPPGSRETGFREQHLASMQPYLWHWGDDQNINTVIPDDFTAAAQSLEEQGYVVRTIQKFYEHGAGEPTWFRLIKPTNKGLDRVEFLKARWYRKFAMWSRELEGDSDPGPDFALRYAGDLACGRAVGLGS